MLKVHRHPPVSFQNGNIRRDNTMGYLGPVHIDIRLLEKEQKEEVLAETIRREHSPGHYPSKPIAQ